MTMALVAAPTQFRFMNKYDPPATEIRLPRNRLAPFSAAQSGHVSNALRVQFGG